MVPCPERRLLSFDWAGGWAKWQQGSLEGQGLTCTPAASPHSTRTRWKREAEGIHRPVSCCLGNQQKMRRQLHVATAKAQHCKGAARLYRARLPPLLPQPTGKLRHEGRGQFPRQASGEVKQTGELLESSSTTCWGRNPTGLKARKCSPPAPPLRQQC